MALAPHALHAFWEPIPCSRPPIPTRIHYRADTGNACRSGATETTLSPE